MNDELNEAIERVRAIIDSPDEAMLNWDEVQVIGVVATARSFWRARSLATWFRQGASRSPAPGHARA